uniref:tRNA (32-2'-O)-methyltransferase regulator THADA n=1 Tax=Nothobranchius korthausae TaxID=1143690 RepID=A0A1A8G080_9TELE
MVVKKKTVKVEAVALNKEKLDKLLASLTLHESEDGVGLLAQTLQSCLEQTDSVQQIQLIKKAASQLEKLNEGKPGGVLDACLNTLVLMFSSTQAKNPLRRAITSALGSVPGWLHERTVNEFSTCLSDCFSNSSSDQFPHVVDTIAACLDGFPLGERCINNLLLEVLQFFSRVLNEYLNQNSALAGRHIAQAQLMQSCLAAVKTSMLVLQRSQDRLRGAQESHDKLEDTLGSLLSCYVHILTDEEFIQSVQSTTGMAVVLLARSVMDPGDQVASVVSGLLRSSMPGLDSAPVWLQQKCQVLCSRGRSPCVSLYLCHGALAMLSWKGALPGPQWERLLMLVPETLLDLDVSVKESSTAMVVARVLTLWSGAALDCLQGETGLLPPSLQTSLSLGSELQRRLLEHIYSHWEHPLDGVRHQTRSLFRNLLLLHQRSNPSVPDPAKDPHIVELTASLLGLEWHMRGKYGSLGCLVELYGAEHLLHVQPQLPLSLLSLMDDQTLAPYASDLLEKLFISHKAQLESSSVKTEDWMERWHQTWVSPLLHTLCLTRPDQTTYILDYFLPKLLRCNPSSLAQMVEALQSTPPCRAGPSGSRGAEGALMTCLRAARAQGVLASSDLWGGLVPISLIQRALLHKHDQVRIDALGLVCENHRSTEVVTSLEMDLIHHFLPPNLSSQSPGIREQTVSLLKKLLCRVRDSTQLLQKRGLHERDHEQKEKDQQVLRQYKEFLRRLCVSLLEVLLPGASFSKCLMSLKLLGLLGQLFTFTSAPDVFALGEIVTPAHAQNVLYCVASNFLEVKQLATSLLQQLPPSAVRLQVPERMQSVLQAALDLSTSTKPFDSVTAAHLLNLLLRQPELNQALLLCAQNQRLDLQISSPPAQASESLLLELNTLDVVRFLLLCLQSEVSRAESSLLQAAASFPLYGRAYCITAVLQHLDTQSLSQTERWRGLVSELLAVCYRMSNVVSPVVQSSSPEGLIPMDTDSETSASLKKILQEIQPRDTNEFFTGSRELHTHPGDDPNTHTPSVSTVRACVWAAAACLTPWGKLLCLCCGEEQPVQVKIIVAKVLVTCASALMMSPRLPLGLPATVSLWRSLFALLQDEDQEVRDAASDFTCAVPAHLISTEGRGMSVCPPAALDFGVALLCQLFELWGQLGAGLVVLTQWLLGEEDGSSDEEEDEASSLDEEDFLFEKGDLNLWAELRLWVNLLHTHLSCLVVKLKQSKDTGAVGPDQILHIQTRARAKAVSSQQALDRLPALPQFSCTMEHARLALQSHRAALALEVLERLSCRH